MQGPGQQACRSQAEEVNSEGPSPLCSGLCLFGIVAFSHDGLCLSCCSVYPSTCKSLPLYAQYGQNLQYAREEGCFLSICSRCGTVCLKNVTPGSIIASCENPPMSRLSGKVSWISEDVQGDIPMCLSCLAHCDVECDACSPPCKSMRTCKI